MIFNRDPNAIDAIEHTLASAAAALKIGPRAAPTALEALFKADPTRVEALSQTIGDERGQLHADYSKHLVDAETLEALAELAEASGMQDAIAAQFSGACVNHTEGRAALHTALRNPDSSLPERALVNEALNAMETLCRAIHSGEWRGFDGRPIDTVINLGIGGSDLGPAMIVDALADFALGRPRVHFVSNVDPAHLSRTLRDADPATTLFIVASKTFSTQETLANAKAARLWLLKAAGETASDHAIAQHFVAATANVEAAAAFGIPAANTLPLWDWVGGRFSLWSAIGLPIALALGFDKFQSLLAGARALDEHFSEAPLQENLPVTLALLSYWYRRFFDSASTAVVPYSEDLGLFPAYLQQLSMESLGKSVTREGEPLAGGSSEVIWGSAGTNGQHSYFQQLHQGTEFIPVDFIACASATVDGGDERQRLLLANCLSQSLALMCGAQSDDAHKRASGGRPSTTLLLDALTPFSLGMLIALYEHKVFALSVLWNINAFDQWGVELGKRLATEVLKEFEREEGADDADAAALDASTRALVARAKAWRKVRD